jgi:hypothetical protein
MAYPHDEEVRWWVFITQVIAIVGGVGLASVLFALQFLSSR